MIRYDMTEEALKDAIREIAPTWLDLAAARTEGFRDAGGYDEKMGMWSAIKDAYLRFQFDKCAFCERPFAAPPEGRIEHDVEHFRPKSAVKAWPTAKIRERRKITFRYPMGDSDAKGYYLLSYSPLNYATACKNCNSSFKSSYFPIAKNRRPLCENPADAKEEEAYIPYPLGKFDDDPERIITFEGILPVPRVKSPSSVRHRRAQVTIAFFNLDLREELLEDRSRVIAALWFFLDRTGDGEAEVVRDYARRMIALATAPSSPHTSCSRAYVDLYRRDVVKATAYFDAAVRYLESKQALRKLTRDAPERDLPPT